MNKFSITLRMNFFEYKILTVIFCFLHYIMRVSLSRFKNIIFTVNIYSTVASMLYAKNSLRRKKFRTRFVKVYFNKYRSTIANVKQK